MIVIHYDELDEAISITEKDAIEKYYDKWKIDMIKKWPDREPDTCFTPKAFIEDFIVVNWAWTTEERLR